MKRLKFYSKMSVLASLLGLLVYFSTACTPIEEEISANPSSALSFSTDTIYFDTLFTKLRSITKRLKVYNSNSQAVNIQSIALSNDSPYSIIVNGVAGTQSDFVIRGNDSIYVLVTVNVDTNNTNNPYIIEDSLIFQTQGIAAKQKVLLRTYGQNAHFFRNEYIGTQIWDDTIKPYVIIDTFAVNKNATLTIKKGVKVYLLPNTFFFVVGNLEIAGTVGSPVVFGGYRKEPQYENQSNQWGQILFLAGSTGKIDHAIIKNGFRGIQTNLPIQGEKQVVLSLSNTLIKNFSGQGLLAFNSKITAWNNVILDCAQNLVACTGGGTYKFYHNTCTYSGNVGYSSRGQGTIFTDFYELSNGVFQNPLNADLTNNLFLGTNVEEFAFGIEGQSSNIARFSSNIIKSKNVQYGLGGDFDANNTLTTKNNFFRNSYKYNFRLDSTSIAVVGGLNLGTASLVPPLNIDIAGNKRNNPDSISRGAYQYVPLQP